MNSQGALDLFLFLLGWLSLARLLWLLVQMGDSLAYPRVQRTSALADALTVIWWVLVAMGAFLLCPGGCS